MSIQNDEYSSFEITISILIKILIVKRIRILWSGPSIGPLKKLGRDMPK